MPSMRSRNCAITYILPVQSGSTRVLRAMQRTYSREEYLEKDCNNPRSETADQHYDGHHRRAFPGETEEDLEETLTLLDIGKYDGCSRFNIRRGRNTSSLAMKDAISEQEKGRRLAYLRKNSAQFRRRKHATWSEKHSRLVVQRCRGAKISGRVILPAIEL